MSTEIRANDDSSYSVRIELAADELAALLEALPEKIEDPGPDTDIAAIQPQGFWPKARHYCVKVYDKRNNNFICQTTIYESPLWAWARASAIGVRKAGTNAYVNMSSGRCVGDQDSCNVS